jgi:hypothetical protein
MTAPGRGGRPGACMSEAFGGNRAHRGNRPVLKRVWSSPRFRFKKMGSHHGKTMHRGKTIPRFSHARTGENACYNREPTLIPHAARASSIMPVLVPMQASAKAENKALENGLSVALYSGCHCTPTTKRASGTLTASICPSGATAST